MTETDGMAHVSAALYALDDETAYLRSLADDLRQGGWSDVAVQPMRARADRIAELTHRLRLVLNPMVILKKNGDVEKLQPGSLMWLEGERPKT